MSVIVVTWNGRELLRGCLEGLARQTYPSFEVVVVDNASTDRTDDLVAAEAPTARLIRNQTNLGFAAANNVGIRATEAPYVALLNNDAVPEPDWLSALVRVAEADESLGSVASKMVFAHDPTTVNSCGIALDPVGIAWDLWGGYPADAVDRPREVFGACAGAALFRRAMLDDVGLLDEDYFAYLEDVDLAWRARLRGWRCVIEPSAVVRHAHAATLGESSPFKRFLLARNKVWTVAKCAPSPQVWRWLPLIALYDVGAAAFGAARQRDWASVEGRLAGLAAIGSALAKRRVIQARRTVSGTALTRLYAPLALPWDVPRRYRHLVPARQGGSEVPAPSPRSRGRPKSVPATIRRMALRGAARLMPTREPTRPGNSPRTAVMRPDHLGDVLLSRGAVESLVAALPDASVTVIAGPWGAPALAGLPARVITFPFPGFTRASKPALWQPYAELLAFAIRLRRERFDAAVVLRPDHWWGALAAALAGIPVRVGHAMPEVEPFLTHPIEARAGESWGGAAQRAVGALIDLFGGSLSDVPRPIRVEPTPRDLGAADRWLADRDLGGPEFGVVHPGAGVALKSWPAHRWAALCQDLPIERVVLSGGPGEESFLASIQSATGRPVSIATGLEWSTLGALFRRARVVVGMDSGPLHLATAVGTPTVRVYGPTDPSIYGPAGAPGQDRVLQGSLACVPCAELEAAPCGYLQDPPCLATVPVADVLAEVRRAIDGAGGARRLG